MAVPNLQRYFERIYDSLQSRRDCVVEELVIEESSPARSAVIEGRISFWDDSTLVFTEIYTMRGVALIRTQYVYQYHDDRGRLRFRYDNSPHYPHVETHPHHKHVVEVQRGTESVEAAKPPSLGEVLLEIETHLYPEDEDGPLDANQKGSS